MDINKCCTNCKNSYLNTKEFFVIQNSSKGTLTNLCRTCKKEIARIRYKNNNGKEYHKLWKREYEKSKRVKGQCSTCTLPTIPNSKTCCEKHWFVKKAKENLGNSKHWEYLKELLVQQNYKCYYSGRKLTIGINASIDHKISKHNGGNNELNNIVWCDHFINTMKHKQNTKEFLNTCQEILDNCEELSYSPNSLTKHINKLIPIN